jgi:hypothetical protein
MSRLIIIVETTQADVEADLLAEEKAEQLQLETNNDPPPVHATTASMFLSMGLDLEDQQYVNIVLTFVRAMLTTLNAGVLHLPKLKTFGVVGGSTLKVLWSGAVQHYANASNRGDRYKPCTCQVSLSYAK